MLDTVWQSLIPFLSQNWIAVLSDLPQIIVAGLATGLQYALIAFGFVLIYRATETVNFAQGDIMMAAMFVGLGLQSLGASWIMVVLGAIVIVGLMGAGLDVLIFRRMSGQSPLATVIITIALGFILRLGVDAVTYFMQGRLPQEESLRPPPLGEQIHFAGVAIDPFDILLIVSALCLVSGLFYFLSKTRVGTAIQASSQNQLAALYQGINVRKLNTLVWGIAAAISAFAGILFAMSKTFTSSVGLSLSGGIMAYAAAVIGGLGSLKGAVLASLMLGIVDNFVKTLSGIHPLISANAGLIFLLVVIIIRPSGLFSQTETKKV